MTRTYACSLNYESMPINYVRDTERHGERGNLHVQNRLSCPLDLSPIHADGQNEAIKVNAPRMAVIIVVGTSLS